MMGDFRVSAAPAAAGRHRRSPGAGLLVPVLVTLAALAADAAPGQRLWSVNEVAARPIPRVVLDGMAALSPATAGVARPATAETASVQVEIDYLRLGFGRLELPLPDGSIIEAESGVFENRGAGNVMWSGAVQGAGYESVLFTLQDGYLVGWFGEPGGPKYVLHAGPDGRGTLAVETGPATRNWCGVEAGGTADLAPHAATSVIRSEPAASESSDRLDILVLYTAGTEAYWRVIGGPAVGIQQLADYLNMVFRNGAMPATANLIPVRWDPELANHPLAQGRHFAHGQRFSKRWTWEFKTDVEVHRLRRRYSPDLVYFLQEVIGGGQADQRVNLSPDVLWAFSGPFFADVFAHEIGHALGGRHEPAMFGDWFPEAQSQAFRPYVFGHTDLTSCREGLGCPYTIMSYGSEATPSASGHWGVGVPFFSTVRHKPNGWTMGVAGEREVERVLHETLAVAVRSGEAALRVVQYPKRINARWTGRDTVRVTWLAPWPLYYEGQANLAAASGENDSYLWHFESSPLAGRPPVLSEESSDNVTPVFASDGSPVGVDIEGLRPGGRYKITVSGAGGALSSDAFHLPPPAREAGSPNPPGNVAAAVTGADSVLLSWQDNSSVETGYEVWYRRWSGNQPDGVWRRYGELAAADARSAEIDRLVAHENIRVTEHGSRWDGQKWVWVEGKYARRGRYSFVVVAHNETGFGASEPFHFEFVPGPWPEPTPSGEITDCTLWRRETGVNLGGYEVTACLETPDGTRRRAWDYGLDADQSGLLYFFDRDNVEILVKLLDGCAINGHRWVFVAPVTTLGFKLAIQEPGPYVVGRRQTWHYDSQRRTQSEIEDLELLGTVGNAVNSTARTVSDTTAFSCTAAEIAAARAGSSSPGKDQAQPSPRGERPPASTATAFLGLGSATDCVPAGPALTLRDGLQVSICYETHAGATGDAKDWGLDSSRSGLLYFFERSNAEILIKVLDGCGVNDHRWVFVAPVTDLAFNLIVESPDGRRWTHSNRLGQTADARSDTSAFRCTSA